MEMTNNKFTILFDEFGTPTFVEDSETNIFAGLAVLYSESVENELFESLRRKLKLGRNEPQKTRRIIIEQAVEIAEIACKKVLHIVFNYVNLRNPEFEKTIRDYEAVVSFGRKIVRGVKSRKISQILHSRLLDNCVHKCVIDHLEDKFDGNYFYEIFMDNWSIPKSDQDLELEHRAELLEMTTNELLQELNRQTRVCIPSVSVLDKDNNRKRLVDGLMSIVSRAFFETKHPRHSKEPLRVIEGALRGRFECKDVTTDEIEFIQERIVEFANEKF